MAHKPHSGNPRETWASGPMGKWDVSEETAAEDGNGRRLCHLERSTLTKRASLITEE